MKTMLMATIIALALIVPLSTGTLTARPEPTVDDEPYYNVTNVLVTSIPNHELPRDVIQVRLEKATGQVMSVIKPKPQVRLEGAPPNYVVVKVVTDEGGHWKLIGWTYIDPEFAKALHADTRPSRHGAR
jgi:hypothetical protein